MKAEQVTLIQRVKVTHILLTNICRRYCNITSLHSLSLLVVPSLMVRSTPYNLLHKLPHTYVHSHLHNPMVPWMERFCGFDEAVRTVSEWLLFDKHDYPCYSTMDH